jgi:E3 ubiquitin-protein ligase NRDP1
MSNIANLKIKPDSIIIDNTKTYNINSKKSSNNNSSKGIKAPSNFNPIPLEWSRDCSSSTIIISGNNTSVFIKEDGYLFRSVVSIAPFTSGRHFWEIHPDPRTENEIKVGVSTSNRFEFNSAFSDYNFGFAFYGLAQTRNGSNASGGHYGKKFKKTGVLGIYLNMNKGTLYFSLSGEDFGKAFESELLKKGPVYPAVALLHHSGCTIKGELPIP